MKNQKYYGYFLAIMQLKKRDHKKKSVFLHRISIHVAFAPIKSDSKDKKTAHKSMDTTEFKQVMLISELNMH